jgi:hypothetical protein
MFKTIVLCASLALPAVAFAAGNPAPATQSLTRASKGGAGVKSLKGARGRSKAKRQGRGVAGKTGKGSARRARSTRAKNALTK